ncbi:MAG: diguanylate cyclase domain-containing protein, partial [Solirubrobacteraceae bacterium]
RQAIAETPFLGVGRKTTSIGICALKDAQDARELFRHADLALYWAKRNGRNATLLYSPETLALPTTDEQAHPLEDAKTLAAIRALAAAAADAKDPSTQRHSAREAESGR